MEENKEEKGTLSKEKLLELRKNMEEISKSGREKAEIEREIDDNKDFVMDILEKINIFKVRKKKSEGELFIVWYFKALIKISIFILHLLLALLGGLMPVYIIYLVIEYIYNFFKGGM